MALFFPQRPARFGKSEPNRVGPGGSEVRPDSGPELSADRTGFEAAQEAREQVAKVEKRSFSGNRGSDRTSRYSSVIRPRAPGRIDGRVRLVLLTDSR